MAKFGSILAVTSAMFKIQGVLAFGYLASLMVSLFYITVNHGTYVEIPVNRLPEKPEILVFALITSVLLYVIGLFIDKKLEAHSEIILNNSHLKTGVFAVTGAWFLASIVSAIVFVWAGIPEPYENHSIFRRFIDGLFESMSGFTTTGASVMPDVEVFPRSILFWRSLTHWYGGMGFAFLAITVFKNFLVQKKHIVNGEAETPVVIDYNSDKEVVDSGFEFIKAYLVVSFLIFISLIISGAYFRLVPYTSWYENVFDAFIHTFGTIGTGGFSSYNKSIGLPVDGNNLIGGLMNPVSEWIIAFGMIFSGINFGLWYILFFKPKQIIYILKNSELKVYISLVLILTGGIWLGLMRDGAFIEAHPNYSSASDALRYAFFNVGTIITTTGFGNTDFTTWPALATGFLFIAFLTGSMVGSTGGGLKVNRFMTAYKYITMEISNMVYGNDHHRFSIDGVDYTRKTASIIIASITVYFSLLLGGGILIMATSPLVIFPDESSRSIDLLSAMVASLSTLGNIGPAAAVGTVDAGPNGNYFAFSMIAKFIMTILMYLGRVGVLAILILFITQKGEQSIQDNLPEAHYESDLHILHS